MSHWLHYKNMTSSWGYANRVSGWTPMMDQRILWWVDVTWPCKLLLMRQSRIHRVLIYSDPQNSEYKHVFSVQDSPTSFMQVAAESRSVEYLMLIFFEDWRRQYVAQRLIVSCRRLLCRWAVAPLSGWQKNWRRSETWRSHERRAIEMLLSRFFH